MDEEDRGLSAMSGRVGDLSPVQEEALKRVRDVCVCVRIVVRYLLYSGPSSKMLSQIFLTSRKRRISTT